MWELEAIAKANYATEEERKRISEEKVESMQKRIQVLADSETISEKDVEELISDLNNLLSVCWKQY